jgi:O-antigen ligase
MRRAALLLAGLVVLLSPFGEGGRRPEVLAVLHVAILLLILVAAISTFAAAGRGRPEGKGIGLLLGPAVFFAIANVAALEAGYPYAALLGVMDLLAAAGAVVSAAVILNRPEDPGRLRALVVASTTIQSGLVLRALAAGGLEAAGRAFLNRNHLAAYLGVGLVLSAAAAEGAAKRAERRAAGGWALLAAIHLAAILPLQSRGVTLGLGASALAFLLLRWRVWSRRARVAALVLSVAVIGGCVVFLAIRFAAGGDPDRYTRVRIWKAAAQMIGAHPLLGIGPGMFPHEAARHNFPLDREPIRYARQFQGGHSALLTTAAETGLPATLILLAVGIGWIGALLPRQPAVASGPGLVDATAFGVGLSLVALLAQALVEDLQQRPAIVLTAALLAGSAIAASRRWRVRGAESPSSPGQHAPGHHAPSQRAPSPVVPQRLALRPLTAAAVVVVVMWIAAGGVIGPWIGWRSAVRARAAGREGLPLMQRAARIDPWNAEYHADLAMATLNSGPPEPGSYARAAIELDLARRCHPGDARLALYRARLEARAGAGLLSDPGAEARAAALYKEAADLAPTDPRPRLEQAGQLSDRGRLEEAIAAAEAALAIEPNYRRARFLQIDLLERLHRDGDLAPAFNRLAATDAALSGYAPDSGYASEIAGDDEALRRRIETHRAPRTGPLEGAASR